MKTIKLLATCKPEEQSGLKIILFGCAILFGIIPVFIRYGINYKTTLFDTEMAWIVAVLAYFVLKDILLDDFDERMKKYRGGDLMKSEIKNRVSVIDKLFDEGMKKKHTEDFAKAFKLWKEVKKDLEKITHESDSKR